jgi:ATP-dependent Clp protease ATP-binding subunit ClpC
MNWFDSTKEILAKWKTQELSGRNNFQKFTPRAQQVLNLARKEAERLKNNFVGTEHILIGLITLGQGVAANVLIKQVSLWKLFASKSKEIATKILNK